MGTVEQAETLRLVTWDHVILEYTDFILEYTDFVDSGETYIFSIVDYPRRGQTMELILDKEHYTIYILSPHTLAAIERL